MKNEKWKTQQQTNEFSVIMLSQQQNHQNSTQKNGMLYFKYNNIN